MDLYTATCLECSKLITQRYSTSFSLGIRAFDKKFRAPIYAIYGFVRYADEIVDTFHDKDKATLIARFRAETFTAIEEKISLNPVLHSFQVVVHEHNMDHHLIDAFLRSMEMDLDKSKYDDSTYIEYIYGSAEVVGLMCLAVFCGRNKQQYEALVLTARSLGAAFQKVNFLRDIKSDFEERGRTYFPEVDFNNFSEADKELIEQDIQKDFDHALEGIKQLPVGSKLGVYIAYRYYLQLFKKIKNTPAETVADKRIRVPDSLKMWLFAKAIVRNKLNYI